MRRTAVSFLAVCLTASARFFGDEPGMSDIDIDLQTGFGSKWNVQDKPRMDFNYWSRDELGTTLFDEWGLPNPDGLVEWAPPHADAFLAGLDSHLPISLGDWAYQPDAGELVGDCSTRATSRTRSKRYQDACPAPESEEEQGICVTDLYPIALCCLGPTAFQLTIVQRCSPCRWSSIPKLCSRLIARVDGALLDICVIPSNIYCCGEYHVEVSFPWPCHSCICPMLVTPVSL